MARPFGEEAPPTVPLTIIIPAYNEAKDIADTIRSLQAQTTPPQDIIVVDDGSSDGTGEIARALGVKVLRPAANTGSKAGAQNFALDAVQTPFVMAVDADTTLAPDAIERLSQAFDQPDVVAACGTVLPRRVASVWERGRYVEYLFAFTFYKRVQDYFGKPLISSGCFSMYRTQALRAHAGWPSRTLAEDMDLTWRFHRAGQSVRFVPDAVCYPIEPHDFSLMSKQLRRWSHGFVQNLQAHGRGLLEVAYLRSAVAVGLWDALVASVAYLVLLPLLVVVTANLWWLLGYVVDAPAVLVPVLAGGIARGETRRALTSFPSFFVLRLVNALFFLEAVWSELITRRSLRVYEKGH